MAYQWTGTPYKGSFKVSYTYPKASKGVTPNGTPLDVNEICGDAVLASLAEQHPEWNLSAEEIRATLSIGYVRQRGGISPDNLYVSTEYTVKYEATSRTAGLSKDTLMHAVADTYYDYFVEKYGRKTDILETDLSDLTQMDYLDIHAYLRTHVKNTAVYFAALLCAGCAVVITGQEPQGKKRRRAEGEARGGEPAADRT